jgi:hypothetical protein
MIRKLGPLAVALMLAALFAIGCGDDNKSDSGGSSGGGTATQSSGGGTSTDSGGGTDVSDNPQVKAAVASCKQSIDSNPAVKDDIKGDLEAICDKAASGNADDVKKAIKEVCEKIVESTVPSGSAQDQAKAACASAGG